MWYFLWFTIQWQDGKSYACSTFFNQKAKYKSSFDILLRFFAVVEGWLLQEMWFSPAPADISIAVQVSVKYVRKVNGTPSSCNGIPYLCLAHTTCGYLAVPFTRTEAYTRSINSNQLPDIRAVCHTTFAISYLVFFFFLFAIHSAWLLFTCGLMLFPMKLWAQMSKLS